MILADKIINERKKNGWSQEELAEKLGVSRQSVSKWEGAQSVPDMQRILDMSRVFGVSTDYLLKDELEELPAALREEAESDSFLRRLSLEEARRFLTLRHEASYRVALGVALCIIGAALVVLLGACGKCFETALGEDGIGALGAVLMLGCIAGGVVLIIGTSRKLEDFAWLEKETFDSEYGVSGLAKEKRSQYKTRFGRFIALGVALCILAVVPLLLSEVFAAGEFLQSIMVSVLLLTIALAVWLFIVSGYHTDSADILLQEGNYTPANKKIAPLLGTVSDIYWLLAVGGFLAWSFVTGGWDRTWIVFPVAGVLFPVALAVTRLAAGAGEE